MQHKVIINDLGLIDYKKAWDIQEKLFKEIIDFKIANKELDNNKQKNSNNYFLFCEHPHVYTLGKNGSENNLLINNKTLQSKNISFYKINRGGDITYHGPGQIVGYPIFDIENFSIGIKDYIYKLEEIIILTLKEYNIYAERLKGAAGVWINTPDKKKISKICAIGVRASRGVTMHGFAFNVNTNLEFFNYINPCGFTDISVTSLEKELHKKINIDEVKKKLIEKLSFVFN